MKIEGLQHAGLFVTDIERSVRFYTEILGFREIWRVTNEFPDGEERVVFVQNGDLVIEIVQQVHPETRRDGWFDHLALRVEALDDLIPLLREKGVTFEEGTYTVAPKVFEKGSKWIMFRGPDNERLELNERLK